MRGSFVLFLRRVLAWARGNLDTLLPRTALANLVANIAIVVTGGAVRLTGSGLGCPTWPQCTADGSYTTTRAMGIHGAIEFGNRTLTFIVSALAIAGFLLALVRPPVGSTEGAGIARQPAGSTEGAGIARQPAGSTEGTGIARQPDRRVVGWAAAVAAGIPAQAVIGGITVLTHLNPWVVALHFLLSIAVITSAYGFWRATRPVRQVDLVRRELRLLSVAIVAVCLAVLTVGTVVTGSGPHAGDATARRTGLDPAQIAQVHADLVFLLLGLVFAGWLALRGPGAAASARSAVTLLVVVLAQGLIGFVQYFTHLPEALVAAHMLGAALVWVATLELWYTQTTRTIPRQLVRGSAGVPEHSVLTVRSP